MSECMPWKLIKRRILSILISLVRRMIKSLTSNIPLKIFSILLAIAIFYTVRESISHTCTIPLSIVGEGLEDGVALQAFSPSIVNVTFRGTESDIRNVMLYQGVDKPYIKVQVAPEVELTHSMVVNRGSVQVVKMEPRRIKAIIDRKATAVLPISEPIIEGAPADGTVKVTFSPKEATVTGSQRRLNQLQALNQGLSLGKIDVSGHSATYSQTVKLNAPDTKGEWNISPPNISVEIQFVREKSFVSYPSQWVNIIQSQRSEVRFKAEPAFVQVQLYGSRNQLKQLKPEDVKVYAQELDNYVTGTVIRVTPEVRLPSHLAVEKVVVLPEQILLTPSAQ